MNSLIQTLDINYEIIGKKIGNDFIAISIKSKLDSLECPYCKNASQKVHSTYVREIQDLPIMDKKTILLVNTRKMYCLNQNCEKKTFTEQHSFVDKRSKKTKRLEEKILKTSSELNSVGASKLLASSHIVVSKSTICDMLKKNPIHCG